MLTAVTGIKWGDEGKGRVIDLLAERADIVVRYQGGNNAGHTVVTKQGKFILNLLPSGILHPNVVCVLADGMVVDLEHLSNEIADIRGKGVSVTPQNFKLSAREPSPCRGIGYKMIWRKNVLRRAELLSALLAGELLMPTAISIAKKHCV